MPDILHKVAMENSTPSDVYKALTTIDGLSAWWTDETKRRGEAGDVIHFRFGDRGFFDMKVLSGEPERRVLWEVVDGPAEWIGTRVMFDLRQEDDFTIVLFKHEGWKEVVEFMHHCSTKWGTFLMSLKAYVESGKGAPYPNDVRIDNWG